MEISNLYMKDNYLNKNISYLFNKKIIEYDLKSANTSLCKEYNLLSKDIISEIEEKPKKERVVIIGKMMRKDSKFKEGLKASFIDIRKRFFELNDIADDDILAIKKDAIFCLKECKHTKIGKCNFIEKNVYTSYLYLNTFEFYYGPSSDEYGKYKIDIKGIDDVIVHKHDGFMLDFFLKAFRHFETSDIQTQFNFLKRFIDKYKHLQLEVGYYREFDREGIIRLSDSNETYDEEIFIPYEHKQEHINIDYNFFNILLPLIKIII